jgi:DNA-binding IclR family transcriptional regulator
VGVNYIPDKTAYQFITAEMEHVAAQTSEICQMGILDQGQVFYIAKVDSKEDIRIASFVGKRLPAYCTALGKAMLSSKTTAELQALYPNGLTPCTQHTVTGFSELERQLQTVNVRGYAYEKGETTDQIECFAVPLCKNKVIFAAISVSVPSFRATTEKNELICSVLMQTRSRIEDYINTNDIAIDTLLLQ